MTLAAVAASLLSGTAANAATTPLVVVGTSDVYDSNLIQSVIEPGFEAAYPQYDLQYVSKGTGAAIAYAEAGTASALIVHAASLENQFVADGYSAEPYGRAVFWGDYVLLGPASDPAGVLDSAPHDVASAFEKIAAAGAAGKADFVSRGGTPGTTVAEHAIWSLTNGVGTCAVSAANGGGTTPSTTAGDCPDTVTTPSWYHATGLTQGPNITNADTCNYANATASGQNDCYVLTDRGTYNYLQSTGAATNLHVVTRDNADTARGTSTALVNSFHAYAINAAKFAGDPNVSIDTTGATDLLNWMTSTTGQKAIGAYLDGSGDAPFIPSATPTLTSSTPRHLAKNGKTVTLTGSISNVVPGTPALAGKKVTLEAVPKSKPSATPTVIASATTDATGKYSITYTPRYNAKYTVATGSITQIENASLSPVFGDTLTATSKTAGTVLVKAKVTLPKLTVTKKNRVNIRVKVSTKAVGSKNVVKLYGHRPGAKAGMHLLKKVHVKDGTKTRALHYSLKLTPKQLKRVSATHPVWKIKAKYSGPDIQNAVSPVRRAKLR